MFLKKDDLTSLKIGDFGLAKVTDYKDTTKCGTLIYMSPEQLLEKGYTKSVDIWASGFILFILCSGGRHPILTKRMDASTYTKSLSTFNHWSFTPDFPLLARNLFLKMCKFEYKKRYESHKILVHPWITRVLSSTIPLTMMETFMKKDLIKLFKNVFSLNFNMSSV